jgi:hypothetical protein
MPRIRLALGTLLFAVATPFAAFPLVPCGGYVLELTSTNP